MMNFRKRGLLIIIMAAIAACTTQRSITASKSITGNWTLIATLVDPGDGSGKWTPPQKTGTEYITFKPTGTISGNAIAGATQYTITDSTHLAINIKGNTAPVTYRYKISGDTLLLNPPCREACGLQFLRKTR